MTETNIKCKYMCVCVCAYTAPSFIRTHNIRAHKSHNIITIYASILLRIGNPVVVVTDVCEKLKSGIVFFQGKFTGIPGKYINRNLITPAFHGRFWK